jgi:hypothetical protein|tara:strand:+ start:40393 stop:40800 length:408 start_codon:yes stop_codon:yes gene_type:complete
MALNSNNQFENFVKGAPLTHSNMSPQSLLGSYATPFKYQDDTPLAGIQNVGAYAGERLCYKKSSNYTSLISNILPHSKLFFVLTEDIINNKQQSLKKTTGQDNPVNVETVLGLTFVGRDTLRYISVDNPNVDKFC